MSESPKPWENEIQLPISFRIPKQSRLANDIIAYSQWQELSISASVRRLIKAGLHWEHIKRDSLESFTSNDED